jgi:ABC-type phosphate/phosphonate transport system substrate-binding protein
MTRNEAMRNIGHEVAGEADSAIGSRRRALALMLGTAGWLRGALAAADGAAPVRLAISESLVADVNLNDARAAMLIWIKRMTQDLNVVVELNPRVFDSTQEIVRRARSGQLDCVALNVVEYRQIADVLDTSQIIAEASASGREQYILLVKRNSGIQHLSDLRGKRLCMLKAPKMCVAGAWLSNILDEEHLGPAEQFLGGLTTETKVSRVVLPVFFGQTEACVTSKRGFDTMCELNPQVAKDLTVIASSPSMVLTFYVFHRHYHGVSRERFAKVYSDLPSSAAGRQLATLFQFERLVLEDNNCLAPALGVLDAAERAHVRRVGGGRKG